MDTPQQSYPKLAEKIGIPMIILKREDLHAYGSHKGRSIPYMIEEYVKPSSAKASEDKQGQTEFVISSSGNAALAAIYIVNDLKDINLKIFVGKNIDKNKLEKLKKLITNENISIEQVERPKQTAFQIDKDGEAKNLRQSTDDLALEGYKSLTDELEKIENLQAIFIPTSSGTTAQALGKFFNEMHPPTLKLRRTKQIHVVQTDFCHPIAQEFDKDYSENEKSIAGAIVDKTAHRKEKVVEIIKNSRGSGWVVNDDEIKNAINLVKETTGIDISPNSALSIAGLQKAIKVGWSWDNPVACLITGK